MKALTTEMSYLTSASLAPAASPGPSRSVLMLGVLRFPSGECKRILSVAGEHVMVVPRHVPTASDQRHHAVRRARLDKGVAVRVSVLMVLMPHRSRKELRCPMRGWPSWLFSPC